MDATGVAWAASGAMSLTGRSDGPPLVAPAGVVERIQELGRPIGVDVLPMLVERAAIAGLRRGGAVSCGGSTRLLQAVDGWIALSLARDGDRDLLPAWIGVPVEAAWEVVAAAVAGVAADELVAQGALLGMAVASVGPEGRGDPVGAERVGEAPAPPFDARPVVVDLSSLWAGPLCARLLGEHGARIIKVESWGRPDGARRGPAAFFDLLHAGHESVALDFADPRDRARLRGLISASDMVIEASRPRALAQLGVAPESFSGDGPAVWISITGYGRKGEAGDRVAFGDDAAAGGGLVAMDERGPCFVADAVADPLTGVAAAAAALAAWRGGGRWILDVSMAGVAAYVAGDSARPPWSAGCAGEAAPARAPRAGAAAPALGAHTDVVLREFAIL